MSGAIQWSEAALRLFDLSGPTAVSAGAGSGKTTCLVELCLRLFSGEATGAICDPSEVVAITFTEKAASELAERLREALLSRAREQRAAGEAESALRWRARLEGLPRMALGTIHGFAARLLREHALEAGLDPDFAVLDEERAAVWREEAALLAVVAALDEGRAEVQRLAAAAGASRLAATVAELARERATLGEVAPLGPAPDRAGEAVASRERLLSAARAAFGLRPQVKTRTGALALSRLGEALEALAPEVVTGAIAPRGMEELARLAAALRGWRVGRSDGEGARELKDALEQEAGAFALLAAEVLAGPQKRELCALVAEAERRYAARRERAGALDFDDLLQRARGLLQQDSIREALRGRVRALLVDEYQDVNALQQELFELLAGPENGRATEGARAPPPLLVAVGDAKQSIYRFRGADVAVFRRLLERMGGAAEAARASPGAGPPAAPRPRAGRVLHLGENHRSSPEVLALVNEVFTRCMRATPGDPRPYELVFREEDRLLARRSPGGAPACEVLVEDGAGGDADERRRLEASAVAARVGALVSGAAGPCVRERDVAGRGESGRPPRFGDMAVLFRRLTQVGPYERALRAAGIPYRLARGGGFYQAPEVRDLGELVATLTAPEDALAWASVLRSPLCGVGEGALFALGRYGYTRLARAAPDEAARALLGLHPQAASPWPDPQLASSEADRLRRFLTVWAVLRERTGRAGVAELLDHAVEELDLEAAHLASPDGARRLGNVRKVLALASRHDAAGEDAASFAARLRRLACQPPREPEAALETADAVALLTIHQAKGLEWPVVFVPDMGATPPADGRRVLRGPDGALAATFYDAARDRHLPTHAVEAARAEARRAGAAESRRLLYVALTRARDRLVLSGEATRGESWRGLVEAALGERPELAVRVQRLPSPPDPGAAPAGTCGSLRELPPGCAVDRNALTPSSPFRPGQGEARATPSVRIAVTALAEHVRCPRRVYLGRHLGLTERGPGGSAAEDDPEHATVRGTLAHALLAELDLGAPPLERRAALLAAVSRRGEDHRAPPVRAVLRDVTRFLDSAAGSRLAAAARRRTLRREVPFLLRLGGDGGPVCYLSGAVDAMIEEGSTLSLIDFKYALPRPSAAERYRFQLLAYALAAARARPGLRIRAAVQFLRGAASAVDVTPSQAELRRFAREAPLLAAAAAGAQELRRSPAELGRDEERCRREACGFAYRCFGAAEQAPGGAGARWGPVGQSATNSC